MGGDNDDIHDPYDATAVPIEEEEESDEIDDDAVSNGVTQREKSGEFGKRTDVPWDAENFDSDGGEWNVQDEGKESPSVWDPDSFVKQTGNLGNWNDSGKKNSRFQDLPSPAVAEPTPEQRKSRENEEEWPFKEGCAFEEKKSKGRNSRSTAGTENASSDIDSVGSPAKARRDGKDDRVGRKNRSAPSMPKRSSGRPDAEDSEGHDRAFQAMKEDADKPLKPKRRSKSKDRGEDNEDDELEEGSFHNLAEDMDKPRSRSAGRKPKGSKRRSHKETSGEDDDDDYEEFGGDDTTEQKLKGDDDAPGSSGAPRKSWRQRRADNRARERSMGSDSSDLSGDADPRGTIDRAPSSAGRRPARRTMIRRSNSERWRKNVDSDTSGLIESDAITRRAKASLANAELSRSAHTMRRYHSGGLHGMTGGLDRRTYHGDRQQGGFERRARKKSSDQLGTASYHGLNDDYDESGRSQRTLDSIEDLEDFERIDFQTPGMVDIEDEIWELMQRANPEDTVHLNRRVHRQREKMAYDQNMPLMTRQALMTRQNSSQVMRGRVDASNIDRRRLLIRNDSNASMGSTDELSYSQHRARYSTTPGRRAPPRSRSSGLAAMAAQSMARAYEQQQQQQDRDGDARRKLFRNKSTNMDSFKQYLNKPNKVAQLSRRAPGSGGDEEIGSNSMRGPSSGGAERRRPVQRAKSTTALRRPVRTDMRRSPRQAEATVPTSIDTKGGKDDVPGLKSPSSKDDDSINSEDSESSSVESMEGDKSPRKAYRKPSKAAAVLAPPKKSPPIKSPKSKKRDLKRKSHRRKLHALLYETKMGVTMKDLHKQVKKADDRDTPAPLMITAP